MQSDFSDQMEFKTAIFSWIKDEDLEKKSQTKNLPPDTKQTWDV